MPYGEAVCSDDGEQTVRPASVIAHVKVGDGPLRKVVFPVPHPDPLLARLLRDECQAQQVRKLSDLAFAPEWRERGKELHGTLVLTRRSGANAITVRSIDGTTHYMIEGPVRTLEAGAARLEIPVVVTPARCDPHAFAEAKKAYLFPVRVTVDREEKPRVVIVIPDEKAQVQMLYYAKKVCGLP
ncbi:hypothetical protein ACIBG7_10665 [Nonomuraea sp. NPDC050328]|uniref:hypothetical protein n=1 Tax=Nonomuraea sp. NPDC050328 TaxID=3364361 RepID=UPI0037964A6D